jgi:hypothetical protein
MQADYSAGSPTAQTNSAAPAAVKTEYWGLDKLKRAYQDYLGNKREEIDEAKEARRYYHGAQWTDAQLKIMKKRKQPVQTLNRIGRKIDGVVGVLERMRQDPKAFPRTPKHEDGADLATACIRYVLDQQEWTPKSSEVARDGAIDGIGGIELNLIQGDSNDPNDKDIEFDIVEPDSYFYDPRSYRADFTDARYMGVAKWIDLEVAKEMFPDKAEELDASLSGGTEFTSNPDRENKWFDTTRKNVRLVDCWYKHNGKWCYSIFTGSSVLMEGPSYFVDEKGETACKYIMYSASVDHDGDRYGFVRNMRSSQDSINFKESKLNHILASRRLIMTNAAVADVEKARAEWARPDGVVIVNPGGEVKADDQSFDFAGWSKLLAEGKTEIENFGPNPAVLGQGVEKQSGRAIQLLQQAGIAELGPYITAYRGWKVRVYRAIWNAIQRHWSGERWIRVTDDDNLAQFIQINGLGYDQNGLPTLINALGSLDVDIIIDEGPDNVNMAADTYDALLALAQSGEQVPPAVLIELSPGIDARTKKKVLKYIEQAQQPGPQQQIALQSEQAKVIETRSRAMLNIAKAQEAGRPELSAPMQPQEYQLPAQLQNAQAVADIEKTYADRELALARAGEANQKAALAPAQMMLEQRNKEQDRAIGARNAAEDRALTAQQFRQRQVS